MNCESLKNARMFNQEDVWVIMDTANTIVDGWMIDGCIDQASIADLSEAVLESVRTHLDCSMDNLQEPALD